MTEQEIEKYKEQLRLRKLGVAMYELQTILGQKISSEEKVKKAKSYFQKIDTAVKTESTILDLMYKITGEKINAEEYKTPIRKQPNPIRKNQAILNDFFQEKETQQPIKTEVKNVSTPNIQQPVQSSAYPIKSYLSIRDIEEKDDEKLFKKGRNKAVSNSIFIIEKNSETEASFATCKEMKTNFFNSFYRSLSGFVFAFEIIGSPSVADDAVETVEKGKLIKEDELWKVVQKAKIKFKKEEE